MQNRVPSNLKDNFHCLYVCGTCDFKISKPLFASLDATEGTVPAELGALNSLEVLNLSYNCLTGMRRRQPE